MTTAREYGAQGVIMLLCCMVVVMVVLQLSGPVAARHQQAKGTGKPQTVCPVMGGPADPSMYVDYRGKRIYICCMACEAAIKVEGDRYIKKIEARGETVADTP